MPETEAEPSWTAATLSAKKVGELFAAGDASASEAAAAFVDNADTAAAKTRRKNALRKLGIVYSKGEWRKKAAPAPKKERKPKKPKAVIAAGKKRKRKEDPRKLKEVGEHIWGSRKDLAQIAQKVREGEYELTGEDLEKLDYGDAAYLVTKKNLVPVHSLETLRALGQTPGAAHLSLAIISMIGAKAPDTKLGRAQYASDVRNVVATLLKARTLNDVIAIHKDMGTQYRETPANTVIETYRRFDPKAYERAEELTAETGIKHHVMHRGSDSNIVIETVKPFAALGSRFEQFLGTFHKPGYMTFGRQGSKVIRTAQNIAKKAEAMGDEGWAALDRSMKAKKKRGATARGWSFVKAVSGEVVRKGATVEVKDANPKRIMRTFGIPNVQYGNWMSQGDRDYHTKALESAYHDLSEILGVDASVMSLQGRIGISMGGRGRGKASAHYESHKKIINLTKFNGGGSLAHEWGHALDNVMAEVAGLTGESAGGVYLTRDPDNQKIPSGVRAAVKSVMQAISKSPNPEKAREDHRKWVEGFRKEANEAVKRHNKTATEVSELVKLARGAISLDDKLRREEDRIPFWEERVAGGGSRKEYAETALRDAHERVAYIKKLQGMTEKQREALLSQKKAVIEMTRLEINAKRKVANQAAKTDPTASNFARAAGMISPKYAAQGVELFARAFESYVEDKLAGAGRRNTYLVDGTTVKYEHPVQMPDGSYGEMYPHGDERAAIYSAMDAMLGVLIESGEIKKALLRMFTIPLAKALATNAL
jgi:hypothetical protein